MTWFVPLLARNEEINRWLNQNPLIVVAIFGVLGAILLVIGALNLMTGRATGKWGTQHGGGSAVLMGGIRVLGGVICLGVAIYNLCKALI